MPVLLSLPERALLRLGIIPAPMVDFVQHATLRLMIAAHNIGVFQALDEQPRSLDELAVRLGADVSALELFLDLLRRLGYIRLSAGRYANTPATTRWLLVRSPHSLEGMLGFLGDLIARWDYFEETVKAGRPPVSAYDFYRAHPDRWPSFHDGQRTIASLTADEVARKARLPGRALRMIDVGGSHGLYTIALCRRYPGLSAVLFDWQEGVEAGWREIARTGMAGRIQTETGDFLTDDLGQGYDAALLGNIIHGQPPDEIAHLLRRVRAAMRDNGILLLVDQVRSRQPLSPFAGYVAQLTGFVLLNELGGGIYPFEQVRAWLRQAGFRDVRLRRLLRTPGFVLIRAVAAGR